MYQDGVSIAFNIIQEELENVVKNLRNEGVQAFQSSEYDKATKLGQTGKDLELFRNKVLQLKNEWTKQFDSSVRDRVKIDVVDEDIQISDISNNGVTYQERKRTFHTRSSKTNIRVTLSDGKIIYNETAAQTFADTIKLAGINRVQSLNLIANGYALISRERHERYGQIQSGDYYIMTNTSTKVKKNLLDKISKMLDLNIKVEII